MKYMRAMLVGATLITGATTWAAAQAMVPVQGWQYRDQDDRQAFKEGFRQGQWDARNGRRADARTNRWREADDRQAYATGYYRGYREMSYTWRGNGDRDRDGGYYGGDRGYGGWNGGYGNFSAARQYGMQDGINDGLNDRRSGHSFRPTHDDNYKHADRGYDYRFGNKDSYKQAYRQAYEQGYQQGYNGGSWQRR